MAFTSFHQIKVGMRVRCVYEHGSSRNHKIGTVEKVDFAHEYIVVKWDDNSAAERGWSCPDSFELYTPDDLS